MGEQRGQPPDPRRVRRSRSSAGRSSALLPGPGPRPAAVRRSPARSRWRCSSSASIGVVRDSASAQLWLSLAYLGIVGADAPGGRRPAAGFLPLVILPAVWLALYGTPAPAADRRSAPRRSCCSLPWALIGGERYPASTPRSALLVLAVAALAGLTHPAAARRGAREPRPAGRRAGRRDRQRDRRDRPRGDDHGLQPGRGADARLSRGGGRRRRHAGACSSTDRRRADVRGRSRWRSPRSARRRGERAS